MFILTVSVSNSNDPTCDRLKLIKHFEVDLTVDPTDFIREAITYVEGLHKELFPRGMSFNIPYTEVEINPEIKPEPERTRHTGNERTYPVDVPSDKPRDESYVVDER